MNTKILSIIVVLALTFTSCDDSKKNKSSATSTSTTTSEVFFRAKETPTKKIDLLAPTLDNKGIGLIKVVKLEEINENLVLKGEKIYKASCTACHKFKKRYIGPALKGVTKRRSPEWIMNMILNVEEMLIKDPVAKALITEYNAPMAQQQISKEEARAVLEYFRSKDKS